MMSESHSATSSRRRFIRLIGGTAAAIPLVNLLGCSDEAARPEVKPTQPPPAATTAPEPAAAPPAPTAPQPAAAEPASVAGAADLPRLAEDDPTAVALGYRHDATTVDTAKYPRRAGPEGATQFCHNCSLFLGQDDQQWAACSIFPGKAVNRDGWCSGWVAKS